MAKMTSPKLELKRIRRELRDATEALSITSERELYEPIIEKLKSRIAELEEELGFKSKKITILVTDAEREKLKRQAEKTGLTLNRFLVTSALRERPPMSQDDAQTIKELRFELRKLGTNLNQSARHINAFRLGTAAAPNRKSVEAILEEIQNLIARIGKTI
jgi:cob(I)alamin adenosyltransferase